LLDVRFKGSGSQGGLTYCTVLYSVCTYWRFGSRVPNGSTRPGSLASNMVGVGTAASGGNRSAGPRLDGQGGRGHRFAQQRQYLRTVAAAAAAADTMVGLLSSDTSVERLTRWT
jgi:hypothetical protein